MTDRPVRLDRPVTDLPGVGPALAGRLADGLDIATVRDLLTHYPRGYQDAGDVVDIAEVRAGEPATLIGEVLDWQTRRVPPKGARKRPLDLAEARVRQASGNVFGVTFFNQRWRASQLAPGTVAAFSGQVKRFRDRLQLASPDVQVLGQVTSGADAAAAAEQLRHQRLLSVYRATDGLASLKINQLIDDALAGLPPIEDWLPERLLDELDLVDLDAAVRGIHQPPDHATRQAARDRLVFDELFSLQLGLQWRRRRLEAATMGLDNGPVTGGLADGLLLALPFAPTGAQTRAMTQIGEDLAGPRPMHRLLQGDVGSGKTVVAAWAMLCAVDRGRQAALMVPTEVLADQHHRTLSDLLAPLGVNVLDGIRVELLTSSTTTSERRRILGELLSGQVDLIVGTHALLEEGVRFADLGVVVVDEQHRFGVSQRVKLKDKAAATVAGDPTGPDVLVMTATPIPRSLALTLYGDLDVTVLDELPPGREPITTQLITPDQAHRRSKLEDFIRTEVAAGRRAYVVCPFVEESAALPGRGAVEEHARLRDEVFPELQVALVHGRLSARDKDAAMAAFRAGEAQVLVSTTVIEVGVDVPEATIMVIEDAERFGISQLHQLRGRVGRGGGRSFCVLFAGWSSALNDDALERLTAVATTTDGFELADVDLAIRGEGQLFGKAQSGLPDLKLARVQDDLAVVQTTRTLARQLLDDDPDLEHPGNATLRTEVLRRYEGGLDAFAALETG
ncbi:MAG: ATP-dependent DNA helicase RecG [Nitriliruptoraceae bacterium]|nr:ATP-dependent DNA helicase RecG [Nitriliruptoraceae bacterium]